MWFEEMKFVLYQNMKKKMDKKTRIQNYFNCKDLEIFQGKFMRNN